MEKPLARWIMHRFSLLYFTFKSNPFTYEEAKNALKNDSMTSIVLASLRKCGWLCATLDGKDLRRRNYTLKDPLTVIDALAHSYEIEISSQDNLTQTTTAKKRGKRRAV